MRRSLRSTGRCRERRARRAWTRAQRRSRVGLLATLIGQARRFHPCSVPGATRGAVPLSTRSGHRWPRCSDLPRVRSRQYECRRSHARRMNGRRRRSGGTESPRRSFPQCDPWRQNITFVRYYPKLLVGARVGRAPRGWRHDRRPRGDLGQPRSCRRGLTGTPYGQPTPAAMVSNSNDRRLHQEKRMTAHEVTVVRPVMTAELGRRIAPSVSDQQRHSCRCHGSVSLEWVTTVLADPSGPATRAATRGMGIRCADPVHRRLDQCTHQSSADCYARSSWPDATNGDALPTRLAKVEVAPRPVRTGYTPLVTRSTARGAGAPLDAGRRHEAGGVDAFAGAP